MIRIQTYLLNRDFFNTRTTADGTASGSSDADDDATTGSGSGLGARRIDKSNPSNSSWSSSSATMWRCTRRHANNEAPKRMYTRT